MVGGGPAGSAAAIIARTFGLDVLVLEAARFPRQHVGESLVSLWSVFDRLGVAEKMDATFQHKRGSCRVWGRERDLKWTDFETFSGQRNYSLQVERSLFDLILLERAEALGATVCQQHPVEKVLWEDERAVGVRYRTPAGNKQEARASWIIDASGRRGMIARRLGLRKVDPFYPDLSVYGYFRNTRRFEGEHNGNLLIEAVPWGWLWFIPLRSGEVSVGLVCDQSSRPALRSQGPASYLQSSIEQSQVVAELLADAALETGPITTASYGYESTQYAGPGWLLAGDAGSFVDPMWATGVAHAIADGIVAATVAEAVRSGRVSEADALDYYHDEHGDRINFNLALVKFVYQANSVHGEHPFWQRRFKASLADGPPVSYIMRRLSRDPSILYFRNAFRGMGLEPGTLSPLESQLERLGHRERLVGSFFADAGSWVPAVRESVRLYSSLGIDSDQRLHKGVAINNDGIIEFTADPFATAALQAVDGRRTAGEVVQHVAATAPTGKRLTTRLQLIATLVDAYERGVIDVRWGG